MIAKLLFSILLVLFCSGIDPASVSHADNTEHAPPAAESQAGRVPDHEITYEETLSPDWKASWDLARSLYRDKMYPEALVQYEILFSQKENIDEARWEYISILMHLERWDNARNELEKLLANEPESIRYRIAMARASVETGNLDNAATLYSRLLDEHINETESILILEGLVKTYELLGQSDEVSELYARLVSLKPEDDDLQLRQAVFELENGNPVRAREICIKLEKSRPRDIEVLTLHAHIEEKLQNKDDAAACWLKILALDPENTDAHRQLYAFYYEKGRWEESYRHLEPLIKRTPNDLTLLKRAAELNMKMDRIDHALQYYEYGLAVDPLNRGLVAGKERAQKELAADLLVLVENDGSKKLWQDLVKVAPDCAGVYREIAVLLREQGKVDELIEVLTLLNKQDPDDQGIYEELSGLLEQQGLMGRLSALRAGRPGLRSSDEN